jgi:hypothetical protein
MNLKENVVKARRILINLRKSSLNDEINIHINAYEMMLCLTEFSLMTNPVRPISHEEEQWFNAGRYIIMLFENSEWSDLVTLYFDITSEVSKRKFFR